MRKRDEMPEKLITVGEARRRLQVGKAKMAELIEKGVLPTEMHPLDRRYKLIREADVERLLQAPARTPKARAA